MIHSEIRVLIADDHTLFLDGLKLLIEKEKDLKVVGQAENGRELICIAAETLPDVIVTDIMMPGINGIEAIKKINEETQIPCIALSTFDDESLIMEAIEAGASGYILKNAQKGEIIRGIKTVNSFHPYYCKATEAKIISMICRERHAASNKSSDFTEREIEIIKYISREMSSEGIGQKLFVSKRTIDGIRAKLLSKMNVKSSAGMVIYALRHHLISLDEIWNEINASDK